MDSDNKIEDKMKPNADLKFPKNDEIKFDTPDLSSSLLVIIIGVILFVFLCSGCVNHDAEATLKQLEVDQKIQSGMIDKQNKKIEELEDKIEKIEKDFNTIPKWKY